MNQTEIRMGKLSPSWKENESQMITFCVTEDCNLRCRYCYMTGKNSRNKMSLDTAYKAVEYILSDEKYFEDKDSLILEFIGGEPFLEIELIDKISDYIKIQMYIKNHRWFNSYRFSFSTNGLLYDTPEVQRYIKKNMNHLSIGISVDGNKIKHDAQRVHEDGTGSFEEVKRVIPLWQQQFPGMATKATFAHDDIIHLKDSIIELWNMGIKEVAANVVFEDVWQEGDDVIYESQLKDLADYIIDNKLWNECTVRFFNSENGFPLKEDDKYRNFCGAGKMMSIDYKGDIYPCIRFMPFTLNQSKGYRLGDIYNGINYDLVRPLRNLTLIAQSTDECLNCEVATGCSWCSGYNYDEACGKTLFHRAVNLCKMTKANVRANEYFWDKLSKLLNIENPRDKIRKENYGKGDLRRFMQFITSDNIIPHCAYESKPDSDVKMPEEIFNKALSFCRKNEFEVVILKGKDDSDKYNEYLRIGNEKNDDIVVYDGVSGDIGFNCIVHVNKQNINQLFDTVDNIAVNNTDLERINVIIDDMISWDDSALKLYKLQLEKISDILYDYYKREKEMSINVITDLFNTKTAKGCGCGTVSFAVSPEGKIYICPAFYFNDPEDSIGNLDEGILDLDRILKLESSNLCRLCDAYHCKRCVYANKLMTNELNTPPKIQCLISHLERNVSRELELRLMKEGLLDPENYIKEIDYIDPYDQIDKEGRKVFA